MRTAKPSCPLQVHRACNWQRGVAPGDTGSSLITGHAFARGTSQFNRLPGVKVGNLVRIKTPPGRVLTFKVTSVNTRTSVRLSERTVASLRSRYGHSRIAINTCNARTYDFAQKRYRHGVVIIAKLVRR